jgi:apolipoprotein N-acyltransferase
MAVFRAVENRRSMARSTASGQTCAVDPNGRVIALAPPFTEAWLIADLPVLTGETLYTRYGDFLPKIGTAAAIGLLIIGFVCRILGFIYKRFAAD